MRVRRLLLCLCVLPASAGVFWAANAWAVGRRLGSHRDVEVFDNGWLYTRSHGRHYAPDGHYSGQLRSPALMDAPSPRLNLVVIRSRDMDRAATFYESLESFSNHIAALQAKE